MCMIDMKHPACRCSLCTAFRRHGIDIEGTGVWNRPRKQSDAWFFVQNYVGKHLDLNDPKNVEVYYNAISRRFADVLKILM